MDLMIHNRLPGNNTLDKSVIERMDSTIQNELSRRKVLYNMRGYKPRFRRKPLINRTEGPSGSERL